jgi:preprotein translocase subunit SecG
MFLLLVLMVIVYVIVCLFLIVVILGQEGKGGGLSGLIGSSALGDTLGASAAESTLRRWTRNCAILFVVLSLGLTIVGSRIFTGSILDQAGGTLPEDVTPPQEAITTSTATLPTEAAPPVTQPPAAPIGAPATAPAPKPPASTPAPAPVSTPAPTPAPSAAPTTAPPR